jgi:hypothetical protein
MSKFNNIFKLLTTILIILFVSACSSIATPPSNNWIDNSIQTNNLSVEKKSFSSDHQLLLSLVNRPLPKDQLMMMRFAQVQYGENSNAPQVNYVSIRGDRSEDKQNAAISFAYSEIIYQDQNSIAHLRFPIIGDINYGDNKQNPFFIKHFGFKRLMLIAKELSFMHPITQKHLVICCEFDPHWQSVFQQLNWEIDD